MAQAPSASSSSSPAFINAGSNMTGAQYNSKIIIASLAMLCFVVLFILALHIYAKWFWRRSARRQQALFRRRQALHFHGQETISVGLDKAVVDSLPTFIYKVSQVLPQGVMECAVCLSEFQENEKGRLLPKCNHSFHTDCIDMWFLSHTTCPLCRTSASADEPRSSPDASSNSEELELSVAMLSEASNRLPSGAYGFDNQGANGQAAFEPTLAEDGDGESLPSPGWRWRRSTSDRFVQNVHAGVQFPTNVLFWGNNSHVSSHTSAPQVQVPRLEHGQRGARSLPPLAIEMPRSSSAQNAMVPRCVSSGAAQVYGEQAIQAQGKATTSGLSVFKRLLSRERRVFPSEQEMVGVCGHGGGMSSGAMASGL